MKRESHDKNRIISFNLFSTKDMYLQRSYEQPKEINLLEGKKKINQGEVYISLDEKGLESNLAHLRHVNSPICVNGVQRQWSNNCRSIIRKMKNSCCT